MDNLYTQTEARARIMIGLNKVADAVKLTLGAGGSNAILQSDLMPGHKITNDGVSVAKAIILEDPVENMGANLIKEVASRADKQSGDGTTTAIVLAQAILKEGLTVEGVSPMQLKKELDECLPLIEASLDAQKKDITVDEVGKVATISAESEELGALIQEAYQHIGAGGIIELDNSNLPETFIEYTEGVRLRFAGWVGNYSTFGGKESILGEKAVFTNPKILISKEKITKVDQIENLFLNLSKQDIGEIVMYVEDIEPAVASRIAKTHIDGGFRSLLIKAPTLWKDWFYEDFALLTGATPVDFANGKTFKNLTLQDLGTCDKIITTKEDTTVIGTKDISEHIEKLNQEALTDDQQKIRANWLNTKAAIIKLGANSDSELSYKRLKMIDAISASKLALESGVVAGGGVALSNAIQSLPDSSGGKILGIALQSPMNQIIKNADNAASIMMRNGENIGWDAKRGVYVDMFEAGIIDAASVTKNSLRNALSVASTVLTTSVVVTLPKPPELNTALQHALMNSNPRL